MVVFLAFSWQFSSMILEMLYYLNLILRIIKHPVATLLK